ncbi:MAG: M23 family metallopeptidase [Elusimicrobia bacterium]|nr:M23 family metallopeptidase [Elusimicrobiota bacterium]
MDRLKKLSEVFSRNVTILIVPQSEWKSLRWQGSLGFLLFFASIWSAFTLWAGFVSGRHVDYWITKADNLVMKTKLSQLAQEMERSREVLEAARTTDDQLRMLLSLSRRRSIVEPEAEAVGGPTAADRMGLRRMLEGPSARLDQPAWRRRIAVLREESYKRLASFQEISWYISNQRSLFQATPSLWPTEGHVTSLFGYRFDPMKSYGDGESGEYHQGIDIANSSDTLIYATADGTVRFSGWSHGYGQMIVLDHGYGLSTLYGHTSKSLVKMGQRISRGQVIAYMGMTGRSTGAHLHYEVWRQGKPVNPMLYLKVREGP